MPGKTPLTAQDNSSSGSSSFEQLLKVCRMKKWMLQFVFLCLSFCSVASPADHQSFLIAPGTLTDHSASLLWDKPAGKSGVEYEVFLNGKKQGASSKANYELNNLQPATSYRVGIALK